jgi:hypothetical protein
VVDLGVVPVGQSVTRRLRLRGPQAYQVFGVRGMDGSFYVRAGGERSAVQELTVLLCVEHAGVVERRVCVETDLPGREEVYLRLRVRAEKEVRK